MNVHVKTGDTVVILSGKDKGKKGKVLAVSPKQGYRRRLQHDQKACKAAPYGRAGRYR